MMEERGSNFATFAAWSANYNPTEFLALSTEWVSSPSKKWERGVSPSFHLVVFVFGVNQEKWGQGESKIHQWWKASLQTFQL